MKNLILKRLIAFIIDYLLILIYLFLLFGITIFIGPKPLGPVSGQLLGFISVTVPVFLYFFLMENKFGATIGKFFMEISINPEKGNLFNRNLCKFLPWEVAHFGIHWIYYFIRLDIQPPVWVWISLIFPQIVVIVYFISIVLTSGKSSVYDKFAQTEVIRSVDNNS